MDGRIEVAVRPTPTQRIALLTIVTVSLGLWIAGDGPNELALAGGLFALLYANWELSAYAARHRIHRRPRRDDETIQFN